MSSLAFFNDQAAKQALAGDQAEVQNVRERCQRAAAAWSVLAAREKRSDDAPETRRTGAAEDDQKMKQPEPSADLG